MFVDGPLGEKEAAFAIGNDRTNHGYGADECHDGRAVSQTYPGDAVICVVIGFRCNFSAELGF
jgi:hypothetical protein